MVGKIFVTIFFSVMIVKRFYALKCLLVKILRIVYLIGVFGLFFFNFVSVMVRILQNFSFLIPMV